MWKYGIALFLVLLYCQNAPATESRRLTELLQSAYAEMQTLQTDFFQEIKHRDSGDTDVYKGVLSFKKPFFLRWEVVSPSPELIVLTEEAAWQYFEDEMLAYKYQPDIHLEAGLLFRVLTGQSRLDEEFDISEIRTENGLTCIHAYPKEPIAQMVEAKIWVDTNSLYVTRVVSLDFYGNSTDVRLSNISINPTLSDDIFTFTPPEGILVEDNTML